MLVFYRKLGQRIRIGNTVKVDILSRNGQQIKIGIEAPRTVSVTRSELRDHIKSSDTKLDYQTGELMMKLKITDGNCS